MKASIFSTLMLISTLSYAQCAMNSNIGSGEIKSTYVQKRGLVVVTHYHDNGTIRETGSFKNGVPEGTWQTFAENGQKTAELNYKNGKRHGEFRVWDLYTHTYTEINYADGQALATNKWVRSDDFATIEK